ncbi:MAG TPA: DUF3592 domain-containing protein [Longimicrobium sp.]|nr:DUF3592 domain-containing protein [Longimicrobium sp.]
MQPRAEPGSDAAKAGGGSVINVVVILGIGLVAYGFLGADGREDADLRRFLVLFGVFWVLVGLGLGVVNLRMQRQAQADQELFASGRKAVAVVDGVRTTGLMVNDDRQIVLRLRVHPAGEPEFAYERRMFVPSHALPRVGDVLEVAYDPADPSRVALATDGSSDAGGAPPLVFGRSDAGAGPAAGESVVDQLERLDRLRQSGSLTFSEFEALKAKLLSGQG